MKKAKTVRDVPEIQKDMAVVIEELIAIRQRLQVLQKDTERTPGYRSSMENGKGEPDKSQITVGWVLHGVISETIDDLDPIVRNLSGASTSQVKAFLKSIKEKA